MKKTQPPVENPPTKNLPHFVNSPHTKEPPTTSSPQETHPPKNTKGKEIETKHQDEGKPSPFQMFKGGKRPHTRPLNKLTLKVKLKKYIDLTKEMIYVDNFPLKYLIIKKVKIAGSKR